MVLLPMLRLRQQKPPKRIGRSAAQKLVKTNFRELTSDQPENRGVPQVSICASGKGSGQFWPGAIIKMKRDQLESSLVAIGVHPSSFSLGSLRHSECVCVVPEDAQWKVFYVERDKPEELSSFPTEEDAYDFVYATFCKWMGLNSP